MTHDQDITNHDVIYKKAVKSNHSNRYLKSKSQIKEIILNHDFKSNYFKSLPSLSTAISIPLMHRYKKMNNEMRIGTNEHII